MLIEHLDVPAAQLIPNNRQVQSRNAHALAEVHPELLPGNFRANVHHQCDQSNGDPHVKQRHPEGGAEQARRQPCTAHVLVHEVRQLMGQDRAGAGQG